MIETDSGTWGDLAGSTIMRAAFFLPLLLLCACDGGDKQQNGVSTNIVDRQDAEPKPIQGNNAAVEEVLPEETSDESTAPVATIPATLQGRWTGINDACADRTAELELNITPDSLIFHESVGTVTRVARQADGRFRVDAAFTGEGQSWRQRLELRTSANGRELTVVNDGTAVTRKRC